MPYRDPAPVRILIYASRSNLIGPVFGQMESIRAVVARRNIAMGLGTALLHQSGWFVQWGEGPADAVQQVVDRVALDPRHGAMHVAHDEVAPRQLHDSWSMAVVHADETPEDFGRKTPVFPDENMGEYAERFRTLGQALALTQMHDSFHAGQMAKLRIALGMESPV